MPKVSVLMPAYNHAKYISQAIDSVLNQTFKNWELIIIDDNSFDNSWQIIQQYVQRDDRIKAVRHNINKGIAITVNEAIDLSEGKYIALFSSDDVWLANKLSLELAVAKKNPGNIIWSNGLLIDKTGQTSNISFVDFCNAANRKKSGFLFKELLKGNYIFGQSVLLHKHMLQDIRYDPMLKYLNDYKFFVDLAYKYPFYFISKPLVLYRIHDTNSISMNKIDWYTDAILVNKYFLQKYGSILSRNDKANIFSNMCDVYLALKDYASAQHVLYTAFLIYPFKFHYFKCIFKTITKQRGWLYSFIKQLYFSYRGDV